MQYAQTLVAPEAIGRGYGAKDLEAMRLKALTERLDSLRPDLKETGIALALYRKRLEEAETQFRRELSEGVGNDFVQSALTMFQADAADLMKARRADMAKITDGAVADLKALRAPAKPTKAK